MKKVTLTKESFGKRNIYKKRTKVVDVPELNGLMGLGEDEVATLKVRQLELDDYLKNRMEITDYVRNLVDGIVEASADKDDVKDELTETLKKMTPEVRYRIGIVKACVIEPKLNRSDVIFIVKMFPMAFMRIFGVIMELTNQGADLKKNSQG